MTITWYHLGDLNQLPIVCQANLKHKMICGVVIVIGSNTNATTNIDLALLKLSQLGEMVILHSHQSADHTHKSTSIYLNTAIAIALKPQLSLTDLNSMTKKIERHCGRIPNSLWVTVDLDIVAVNLGQWHLIKQRLPLKPHEVLCLSDPHNHTPYP